MPIYCRSFIRGVLIIYEGFTGPKLIPNPVEATVNCNKSEENEKDFRSVKEIMVLLIMADT
jgi:hypothetical protein